MGVWLEAIKEGIMIYFWVLDFLVVLLTVVEMLGTMRAA